MDLTPQVVNMDDLVKRQTAMDAYQQRLNEMQKMDFRKAKEELDQAKVEKMHADVFKTKVSTQKTIIDAQSALQQIQMQVQAAARQGYAGVKADKLSNTEIALKDNEEKMALKKGKEKFTPAGGSLSLQIDADKLQGKADGFPAFKRIRGINDWFAEKASKIPPPQKLLKDAAPISKSIMNALKMENAAGWALMPGLAGAAIGGGLGAAYSGFDPNYALGDAAKGALIGGGVGALFGHNYGKNKLKDMLGGTLEPGQNPYSLKAIRNTDVNAVMKAREAAAAKVSLDAQVAAETAKAQAQAAAGARPFTPTAAGFSDEVHELEAMARKLKTRITDTDIAKIVESEAQRINALYPNMPRIDPDTIRKNMAVKLSANP